MSEICKHVLEIDEKGHFAYCLQCKGEWSLQMLCDELAILSTENERLEDQVAYLSPLKQHHAEHHRIDDEKTPENWAAMQGVVDAARAHNDVCDSLYDEALANAIKEYDALNGEEE